MAKNGNGKKKNGNAHSEDWWKRARRRYIESDLTYDEVAKEFSTSKFTLVRRGSASHEDWPGKRAEFKDASIKAEHRQTLIARIKSEEYKGETRMRYARDAREVMGYLMKRTRAAFDADRFSPHLACQITAAMRRCQEVEFAALGLAMHKFEIDANFEGPASFAEFFVRTREERGLPKTKKPFLRLPAPDERAH